MDHVKCLECKGKGYTLRYPDQKVVYCISCNGSGKGVPPCPKCNGTGIEEVFEGVGMSLICRKCYGTGRQEEVRG